MSETGRVAGEVEATVAGMAGLAAFALATARDQHVREAARRAQVAAAARGAAARVYANSAATLRERLADEREENLSLRGEIRRLEEEKASLRRQLDAVCAYAHSLRQESAA